MSCSTPTVYVGNTSAVKLTGLLGTPSGDFINDASVQFEVVDADQNPVAGQSFPAAMPHVAASSGDYVGIMSASLALVAGHTYTIIVTATQAFPATGVSQWEIVFAPLTR